MSEYTEFYNKVMKAADAINDEYSENKKPKSKFEVGSVWIHPDNGTVFKINDNGSADILHSKRKPPYYRGVFVSTDKDSNPFYLPPTQEQLDDRGEEIDKIAVPTKDDIYVGYHGLICGKGHLIKVDNLRMEIFNGLRYILKKKAKKQDDEFWGTSVMDDVMRNIYKTCGIDPAYPDGDKSKCSLFLNTEGADMPWECIAEGDDESHLITQLVDGQSRLENKVTELTAELDRVTKIAKDVDRVNEHNVKTMVNQKSEINRLKGFLETANGLTDKAHRRNITLLDKLENQTPDTRLVNLERLRKAWEMVMKCNPLAKAEYESVLALDNEIDKG